MRSFLLFTLFIALSSFLFAQTPNPNYDEALAIKLDADDYGMKSYVFVMLKTGSNTSENDSLRKAAFAGHMNNMKKMAEDSILIVAGPLGKNDLSYRGIFILNVPTVEAAKEVLQTDPAIKANYLDADLYEWYGSAALSEYQKASKKVGKFNF